MRRSAGSKAGDPMRRNSTRAHAVRGGFVRRAAASIVCTLCVLPLAGALAVVAPAFTPSAQASGTGTCTIGVQSSSQNDTCAVTSETGSSYTVTLTHNLPYPVCTSTSQTNCTVLESIGNGTADPKTINCPFYSGTLPTQVLASTITSPTFTCTLTGPDSEFGPEEIFAENVREGTPPNTFNVIDATETAFLINPQGTGSVVNPTASFTTTPSTSTPLTWDFDASKFLAGVRPDDHQLRMGLR